MANPLFNAIMGGSEAVQSKPSQEYQQTPTGAQSAPQAPQMSFQDAMHELQTNPAKMIRQAGFNIPDEIANNPQASVMHLIQSGQVGGPMMQRIRPMLNMLMGRR